MPQHQVGVAVAVPVAGGHGQQIAARNAGKWVVGCLLQLVGRHLRRAGVAVVQDAGLLVCSAGEADQHVGLAVCVHIDQRQSDARGAVGRVGHKVDAVKRVGVGTVRGTVLQHKSAITLLQVGARRDCLRAAGAPALTDHQVHTAIAVEVAHIGNGKARKNLCAHWAGLQRVRLHGDELAHRLVQREGD